MAIHPTNRKTIGTCSECGGPVQTPEIWGAITPPPIECADCGACPKQSHGPVIEMERPAKRNRRDVDTDLLRRLFDEEFIRQIRESIRRGAQARDSIAGRLARLAPQDPKSWR